MNISSLSSGALYAKSKAMNAGRITDRQYSEMCALSDISELYSYLKNRTAYSEAFSGLGSIKMSRTRLEAVIRRMVYLREARLMKYTSITGSGLETYFIKRMEADFIISCARHTDSMFAVDPYMLYIPQRTRELLDIDISALENSRSPAELLLALSGTEYVKILSKTLESSEGSFVHIQNVLYRNLFERTAAELKKKLSENEAKQAVEELSVMSDILTLSSLYRTKKYYSENDKMLIHVFRTSLTNISDKVLSALLSCTDLKALEAMIGRTRYGKLFSANYESHNMAKRILFTYCKKNLTKSQNSVACAISYGELVRIEAANISTIAEGLAYKMAPDDIAGLLIKE